MRLIFTTFILLFTFLVDAQITYMDSVDVGQRSDTTYRADTLLPFHGKKPLRLHPYQSRVIPYNAVRPLYVSISYAESPVIRYEYFREDSSTYLLREYFRDVKASSNEGLKASGHLSIQPAITDSSRIYRHSASSDDITIITQYYQGFYKQSVWEEYQDLLFCHRCWTGTYKDNKRVGIWNEYIYRPGWDAYHLAQRNYNIDSTAMITTPNLATYATIDTIVALLQGRWMLGCEDDADRRR